MNSEPSATSNSGKEPVAGSRSFTKPSPGAAKGGCSHVVLVIGLAALLVAGLAVASLMPVIVFVWQQIETANDAVRPAYATPLLAMAQAGLMAFVCLPVQFARRWPRVRAVATLWLVGALLLMICAPIQALTVSRDVAAYILLAGVSLGLLALLRLWAKAGGQRRPVSMSYRVGDVVAMLPLVVILWIPWLIRGALGSVLDSVLAGLVALSIGIWISTLDELILAPAFDDNTQIRPGGTMLRGVGLGVLALLLAKALGFYGHSLLLMAAVAPLGLGFAKLAQRTVSSRGALTALVSGVAFAPLAFTDTKEFSIVLGGADIPGVLLLTAAIAFLLAVLVGALLVKMQTGVFLSTMGGRIALVVGSIAVATVAYVGFGQPGLYSDRIFVIMRGTADLRPVSGIQDRAARANATYKVLTTYATANQLDLRSQLTMFGIKAKPYYLVNAVEIESPLDGGALLALWLKGRSDVDHVLASPHHHPLSRALGGVPAAQSTSPDGEPASDRPGSLPWGIRQIGADRVWSLFNTRGAGIVVGNTDSGIDGTHENLRDNYRGASKGSLTGDGYNWFDPWGGQRSPVDYGEHGTHTMGTIIGKYTGVAPDATWIGCVNLARNLGNPAVYLDCMQFMLAPHPQGGDPFTDGRTDLGANVINNSWGCPDLEGCDANVYVDAVHALRVAGIFMAVSAGNSGPECSSITAAPALYAEVFTVGAYDSRGDLADFSSRGPVIVDGSNRNKPDVIAPGVAVVSSVPHNKYMANSGTSMASPHVAGIVALMWSANPKLIGSIDRTESILRESTVPYKGAGVISCIATNANPKFSNATGYGMVDAFAAVKQALAER